MAGAVHHSSSSFLHKTLSRHLSVGVSCLLHRCLIIFDPSSFPLSLSVQRRVCSFNKTRKQTRKQQKVVLSISPLSILANLFFGGIISYSFVHLQYQTRNGAVTEQSTGNILHQKAGYSGDWTGKQVGLLVRESFRRQLAFLGKLVRFRIAGGGLPRFFRD